MWGASQISIIYSDGLILTRQTPTTPRSATSSVPLFYTGPPRGDIIVTRSFRGAHGAPQITWWARTWDGSKFSYEILIMQFMGVQYWGAEKRQKSWSPGHIKTILQQRALPKDEGRCP